MGGAHDTVKEKRSACSVLVSKPSNKINLENLGVDGMMLLKWNLNRMGEGGMELCGSGKVQVVGCCEKGDEPLSSLKCREFCGYLRQTVSSKSTLLCDVSQVSTVTEKWLSFILRIVQTNT